jgi:putative flippase GtrA
VADVALRTPHRFVLFALIGTLGFVVDVTVLYAAASWLGWYAGRVVSFLVAASVTWHLNRRWTFADAAPASRAGLHPYLRYVASMLAGAMLNYAVYAFTLQAAPFEHAAALGVALGSIAGLGLNFLAARFLVFGRHP